MASFNQLTLLQDFEKYARRDSKLVDDLVSAIGNLKYFRVNTRFSDFEQKAEIEEALNQVIYWVAFLAFKKARFVDKYRKKNTLEDFLELTKEKSYLSVAESLSQETLKEYYKNAHLRMNTSFMAYKDLLKDERSITKRILDNFDLIHQLV